MPTRDELLDALARADRLALAAHLRAPDGPVRDTLVDVRGHLRSLAHAVVLRPYRWLPVVSYLALVAVTVGAALGLRLIAPWYLAVPLAALAGGFAVSSTRRIVAPDPYADLDARAVAVPEAVALPDLVEELWETTTRATAVIGGWSRATVHRRPDRGHPYRFEPAPLVVHVDACLARLRGLVDGSLSSPAWPDLGEVRSVLRRLRPVLPWVHALVHDAHRELAGHPRAARRLARMDLAYLRLHAVLPPPDERHRPPRSGRSPWLAVGFAVAGGVLAVSPWPVVAVLAAVLLAFTAVAAPRVGADTCAGIRQFNRSADVGTLAVEAARRLEEAAGEAGGVVGEELRRVRDLLRGRGSG